MISSCGFGLVVFGLSERDGESGVEILLATCHRVTTGVIPVVTVNPCPH